jgi:methylmalonyl-CoA mutase N-terminal domain/subunit
MTSVHEFEPALGGDSQPRDAREVDRLRAEVAMWREKFARARVRDTAFSNSADEVAPLYTALDTGARVDAEVPGRVPVHARHPPHGLPRQAVDDAPVRGLLDGARDQRAVQVPASQGQTGLSVAFDFPTLMGYDADHPRSEGEVGKCGVSISSLADMETLMEGIPLGKVSTSMTINGPAVILFCFYAPRPRSRACRSRRSRGRSRTTSSRSTWRSTRGASPSSPRCA